VQAAIAIESKSKQARHEVLVFGQSNHAVPDVAGWQNVQFFPQAAGAPSIIRHRHDNGQVRAKFF